MSGQYPAAPGAFTTQPFWPLIVRAGTSAVSSTPSRLALTAWFPACTEYVTSNGATALKPAQFTSFVSMAMFCCRVKARVHVEPSAALTSALADALLLSSWCAMRSLSGMPPG